MQSQKGYFMPSPFSGLAVYGLVAALVLVLTVGGYSYFQGRKINRLNKEVATLEVAVATYRQVNIENAATMEQLLLINEECAAKRKSAEDAAKAITDAMNRFIEQAKKRRKESQDELAKASRITVCTIPVPARTTRLLVEAASSANRAKDGN